MYVECHPLLHCDEFFELCILKFILQIYTNSSPILMSMIYHYKPIHKYLMAFSSDQLLLYTSKTYTIINYY